MAMSEENRKKKSEHMKRVNAKKTPEQRHEHAVNAAKASVESRRARRSLADELCLLLSQKDVQERVVLALINTAMEGNPKAFEVIRDTIGEKPKEQIEMANNITVEVEL